MVFLHPSTVELGQAMTVILAPMTRLARTADRVFR